VPASCVGVDAARVAELEDYYSRGSHYGIPASMVLFELAHEMQLGGSYLLWCDPQAPQCEAPNCGTCWGAILRLCWLSSPMNSPDKPLNDRMDSQTLPPRCEASQRDAVRSAEVLAAIA
jgi:hypothetical protein